MIPYLIAVVALLFFIYDRLKFRHWKVRGVKHTTPWPFFGHYAPVTFGLQAPGDMYGSHYQLYKDRPYFGVYEYHRPVLLINDLNLVEHVLVKNFSSFADHPRWVIDEKSYLNEILLNLRGNLWRATRYKLTPSFTMSKMQLALDRMLTLGLPQFEEGEVEIQRKMNAVAADMIVAYFGATIQNKKAFSQAMYEQTYIGPLRHLELQLLEHFPKVAAWSGVSLIHRNMNDIMTEAVRLLFNGCGAKSEFRSLLESIKSEGVLKMKGSDFDINENAAVEHIFDASDKLLLGQVSQFFFAGLDATSNTMGFLAYELATNPEAQQEARKEAQAAFARHGEWNYQLLQELQYMQYCINESTRLHSVLPFLFREATRDFTFPGTNLSVKKGDKVVVPAGSLQTDPRYYPDPLAFKPERWQEINKQKKNYTWLPFGEGPRQCLGMRFAFMEMKLVFAKLLTEFEITPSSRTKLPAGSGIMGFIGRLDRPVHIRFTKLK